MCVRLQFMFKTLSVVATVATTTGIAVPFAADVATTTFLFQWLTMNNFVVISDLSFYCHRLTARPI